ncbi:MAG: iron uptake porin [Cyanobacteria bacterium P01_E01_bin.42]
MAATDVAAVEIWETLDPQMLKHNALDQINSVSQLRDVFPGDWAFEALRNLSDCYNCIVGYPNGTYRGDRAMSRYEFAAGLNACLGQIERLLGENDFASRADLETLTRLQEEFAEELAILGTRVDGLESRVAFLEDHLYHDPTARRGRFFVKQCVWR